eukprot:TRINITY_DN10911_c0_g1_i1.p1 TRINITY_DN10911_c0_g1~~TRINITY_DN10911_c0_g1_i1.p1  ORF type:complete len:145 (+),score=40.44 TRINITY_DN10911_c0_g1_i1:327-761(+)
MQRWLRVMLQQLLPEQTEVEEDFLHEGLLWDSLKDRRMQLDIWVPKYNLALEYQGEQHYYDIPGRDGPGSSVVVFERDQQKREACAKNGITLVQIPYWWDNSEEQLSSTLNLLRPELFPKTKSLPIPKDPPHSVVQKVGSSPKN